MKIGAFLFIAAVLHGPFAGAADVKHKLECPEFAPAGWGAGKGALSGVDVLSSPAGEPIDEHAPPTLAPDDETVEGGTLRQTWQMNNDGAGFVSFVDCHYQGTPRPLRLDAKATKICVRSIAPFDKAKGAAADAKQALYCD